MENKFKDWLDSKGVEIKFLPGDKVRFNSKIGKDEGFIVGVHFGTGSCYYDVIWSDKGIKSHYDFELENY